MSRLEIFLVVLPATWDSYVSLCVSLLACAFSVVAIIRAGRQKRIDNLVNLYLFLHRDELSAARLYIRSEMAVPSLNDNQVRLVCSSFDLAGTLVRHKAVDQKVFLDYWCRPLLECERPLRNFAKSMTGKITVEEYYKDFWWLMRRAKEKRESDQCRQDA
jgi:small basic protein